MDVEDLPQHRQVVVLEGCLAMVEDRLLIPYPIVIDVVHAIVVEVMTQRYDQQPTDVQVAQHRR